MDQQAYIKSLEAKVAELSRLAEYGNGPVLLGWMDAHSKAMDKLCALEREFRNLQKSYQYLNNRNLKLEALVHDEHGN